MVATQCGNEIVFVFYGSGRPNIYPQHVLPAAGSEIASDACYGHTHTVFDSWIYLRFVYCNYIIT